MNDTKKNSISVCLVAHNEEGVIKRCLDSVVPLADEIIIVHDGPCADKTLESAANYGARIIIAERAASAEPNRPLSYEAARGEWILQIDADEFLSPDLQAALPKLAAEKNVDAYEFLWPLYDGERYRTKHWPFKRAMFRHSVMSFLGTPNDFVVGVPGKVKRLPLLLEHRPTYNNYTWKKFCTKWLTAAKIQAELYVGDFSAIKKFQYRADGWSKKILLRIKHPLLITPFDVAFVIVKNLYSGAYKEGLFAWRVVFMWGLFRALTNWLVFRSRKNQYEG